MCPNFPTCCGAGVTAASRDSAPKAHPGGQRNSEPQQRLRAQPKVQQPQSPPAPPLSASMNPAIHAKLQQAHNKLLAQSSRGPRQQDDIAAMVKQGSSRPGAKKGRAAAQPEPAAGRAPATVTLKGLETAAVHTNSLPVISKKLQLCFSAQQSCRSCSACQRVVTRPPSSQHIASVHSDS